MALAAGDDLSLSQRPDRHQIVLATGHDILAVGRPADTNHASIVAREDIHHPVRTSVDSLVANLQTLIADSLLFQIIDDPKRTILEHEGQMTVVR